MVFDDIIVGSGLAALGTVLGLAPERRVLVLGGERQGSAQFYDATRAVPCARMAHGGLGEYWHGVIPTGGREVLGGDAQALASLAEYFYPGTDFAARLGQPWLFVPRHPIRPSRHWQRLLVERKSALELRHESVQRFVLTQDRVSVITASGTCEARRLWLCAGTLHTPALLERSFGARVARPTVSDHVICYLGLHERASTGSSPRVVRDRNGAWFECRFDAAATSLYTLRPARFRFRQLDFGLEQRAAFGLPMRGALGKILRRASPGLVSEALFNKFGLFPNARTFSCYAQVTVTDAYEISAEGALAPRTAAIQSAVAAARSTPAWSGLMPSALPELYLPGIHLHGSVDTEALRLVAGDEATSPLQVVDASVYRGVGPEHHSFKVMAAAAGRARRLCQ